MDVFFDPSTYISFLTLTVLELVLGIDNLLFISIVTSRLPKVQQVLAWRIGLLFAIVGRISLLFSLSFVFSLTKPLVTILGLSLSGRDLVLGLGGLFLLYKSTQEIIYHLDYDQIHNKSVKKAPSLTATIVQIFFLDLVFSLDSIITAIGLVSHIPIMAAAIIVAVLLMLLFSTYISNFVLEHPSIKVLGLSFLIMISVLLIAECFGHHVPRGYVYFALGFSMMVETINLIHRKRSGQKRAS